MRVDFLILSERGTAVVLVEATQKNSTKGYGRPTDATDGDDGSRALEIDSSICHQE